MGEEGPMGEKGEKVCRIHFFKKLSTFLEPKQRNQLWPERLKNMNLMFAMRARSCREQQKSRGQGPSAVVSSSWMRPLCLNWI